MAPNRQKVIQAAEKLVARGRIQAAIDEYRKVLDRHPNDTSTLNRVGDLYARLNRMQEAIDLFQQTAENFGRQGFFVKSIAIYKKIIRLDPGQIRAYEALADLYNRQGLTGDSLAQYQVVADYYQKHGDAESAIGVYYNMVEIEPNNPTRRLQLAGMLQRAAKKKEALDQYFEIANLMLGHSRGDDALRVLQGALEVDAEDLGFLRRAAEALKESGFDKLAESFLEMAVQLNPEASSIDLDALGLVESVTEAEEAEAATETEVAEEGVETVEAEAEEAAESAVAEVGAPAEEVEAPAEEGEATDEEVELLDLDEIGRAAEVSPPKPPAEAAAGERVVDLDSPEASEEFVLEDAEAEEAEAASAADVEAKEEVEEDLGFELDVEEVSAEIARQVEAEEDESEGDEAALEAAEEAEAEAEEVEEPEPTVEDAALVEAGAVEEPATTEAEAVEEEAAAEGVSASVEASEEDTAEALAESAEETATTELEVEETPAEPEVEEVLAEPDEVAVEEPTVAAGEGEAAEEVLAEERIAEEAEAPPEPVASTPDEAEVVGEELAVESAPVEEEGEEAEELAALEEVATDEEAPTEKPLVEEVLSEVVERPQVVSGLAGSDLQVSGESIKLLIEAEVLSRYGMDEMAIGVLEKILANDPRNVEAMARVVRLQLGLDRTGEALVVANQLADLAQTVGPPKNWPELCDAMARRGFLLTEDRFVGELEPRAAADVEAAEEAPTGPGEDTALLESALGTIAEDGGERDEALAVEPPVEVETEAEPPEGAEAAVPGTSEEVEPPSREEVELEAFAEELVTDSRREETRRRLEATEDVLADVIDEIEREVSAPPGESVVEPEPEAEVEPEVEREPEPELEPEPEVEAPSLSAESLGDESEWLEQLEAGRVLEPPTGEFVDLATELEAELIEEDGLDEELLPEVREQSLEDIVEGFRKGMAETLSEEDYDTHYNLGIAYREMGLIDEAIGEFQMAAKDPRYLVECSSMLASCFVDKNFFDLAVQWYVRGLDSPAIEEDARLGLLYELGTLLAVTGEREAARERFLEIYGINSNYRDVVAKLEELSP